MSENTREGLNPMTVIDTSALEAPTPAGGLRGNRAAAYAMYGTPKCSVVVIGYDRLDKTRYCVECILRNTQDVDYELILIDNGSQDGTLAFFGAVEHPRKRVVRVTKNIGSSFPHRRVLEMYAGKYLVTVSNDVYVTPRWLSNLLTCLESDPAIGYVQPVSSNVSNFQQVDLPYADFEDMQRKAEGFNISNPYKWFERVRLIGIIGLFPREVLEAVGNVDPAFVHDFGEDDLSLRIRRAGYKLLLCCDTWVCHDHDFRNNEGKDPQAFAHSLESGREIFREKYPGLDAWDDTLNFEFFLLDPLRVMPLPEGEVRMLAIDGRCGTPLLQMRNHLRERGRTDCVSFAFTTDAKYYADLRAVTANVACDRIAYIGEHYRPGGMHAVALCEPLDAYESPLVLLKTLCGLLAPGGMLLLRLRNADCFRVLRRAFGKGEAHGKTLSLSPETAAACLAASGAGGITIMREEEAFSPQEEEELRFLLGRLELDGDEELTARMRTATYVFCARKG